MNPRLFFVFRALRIDQRQVWKLIRFTGKFVKNQIHTGTISGMKKQWIKIYWNPQNIVLIYSCPKHIYIKQIVTCCIIVDMDVIVLVKCRWRSLELHFLHSLQQFWEIWNKSSFIFHILSHAFVHKSWLQNQCILSYLYLKYVYRQLDKTNFRLYQRLNHVKRYTIM